eukprot:CAMPEP_0183318024 /NCGR_PEP_ID=MMETSP0160_2-20130417/59501_1 /TAXON_ID=2839 ORGANISM="Odontella Sinensis, Strain Grunow 1884" /NCGR_SAMPLE_ID=MMETSP0160_2 /ASSEMBLY_ACC=CAM_ASM_000250 /LENGTH=40 /DNA_ID= /DNA_START= /DNA_END= /DNA_ORIENTATION=
MSKNRAAPFCAQDSCTEMESGPAVVSQHTSEMLRPTSDGG